MRPAGRPSFKGFMCKYNKRAVGRRRAATLLYVIVRTLHQIRTRAPTPPVPFPNTTARSPHAPTPHSPSSRWAITFSPRISWSSASLFRI
eukprot:scaffold10153_cov111-Isochrysis_galbana.AAC.1